MKKTKLELYGDTFGDRNKIAESMKNVNITKAREKMVKTKRELYGKSLCKNIEGEKEKWRSSMQNNKSSMSTWESEAFNLLQTKFTDVRFNYYDKERYPYLCDFYIGDLDLFIELNYHWSHGFEPFVASKKQLDTIELWKSKGWYGNIKTWTVKDVKKRQIAEINNLNYKEFFNKESFIDWFNTI